MLGQVQREIMASGSRMVNEQNIYETVRRVLGTFGIEHVSPFINDPKQLQPEPPKQEPPDPTLLAIQSQDKKFQADAQRDAAKLAADERERVREHERAMKRLEIEEIKLTNSIQTEEDRLDLDKQKAVMDDDFKRDKLEVDAATGHMREMAKAVTSTPPVSYGKVAK